MTTSKRYITLMSACCFLAIGNNHLCAAVCEQPQHSSMGEHYWIEDMANDAFKRFPAYKASKNYKDIGENDSKACLMHICKSRCNRFSCNCHQPMKEACAYACPPEDVKNCLASGCSVDR